mmetsp:Transcript_20801/g.34847  ORF Transcript_20801/g.34847 Transcript_20801/m.34847 type:complete len:239 (-) Transcript_20801:105-821(-)
MEAMRNPCASTTWLNCVSKYMRILCQLSVDDEKDDDCWCWCSALCTLFGYTSRNSVSTAGIIWERRPKKCVFTCREVSQLNVAPTRPTSLRSSSARNSATQGGCFCWWTSSSCCCCCCWEWVSGTVRGPRVPELVKKTAENRSSMVSAAAAREVVVVVAVVLRAECRSCDARTSCSNERVMRCKYISLDAYCQCRMATSERSAGISKNKGLSHPSPSSSLFSLSVPLLVPLLLTTLNK